MALVLADRVRDTTTTTGTGTVTLSGTAPTGYQTFGAAIGNTNTTYYTINAGSQWEVGLGTYSSTGPTLARTTVLASSSGGSLVDFSTGTKDVFVTYPAEEAVYQDGSAIKAGTAILGVANGGTGAATLTSGYLLKGNGTSAVSASVVYDNGTNVGIGTTAPQSKMEIRATSGGSTFNALTLSNYVGASVNTGVALYFDPNGAGSLARAASIQSIQSTSGNYADLRFFTANSDTPVERMRIAVNGNVSIGTGTPNAPLDVLVGSNQRLLFTERGTSGGVIDCVNAANNAYQLLVLNSSIMAFQTGATERMRIDASGNVGIGTSSPGAVLQLNKASGAADLRFSVAGTLYGNMYASSSDMDIFAVTAIPLILGTNNTERMRIDSSGNVGIATSTPQTRFEVYGGLIAGSENRQTHPNANAAGGFKAQWNYSGGSAETDLYNLYNGASESFRFYQTTGSGTAQILYSMLPTAHLFYTGGNERMRITSGGIVQVNTTSTPSFGTPKLVVDGGISGKGTVTINSSTATTIAQGAGLLILVRNNTNGGTAVVSYENAQTPVIISTSGGTTFQTTTPSGSAQIQLTNRSGNLGIAALASGDRNGNELSVTILQTF